MKAIVLSVGSELLRGDILDTNAAYLTRRLSELSIVVERVEQHGDDLDDLTATVSNALRDADLLVCTGGLGPTQDDLTRDAIAGALGEEMHPDPDLVRDIEDRFASLQRRMPESNVRQALTIPSARSIRNPNGTAPGWFVQCDGKTIVTLPGPPSEMQPMWQDSIEPMLESLLSGAVARRGLMTFGLGESTVEQRIERVIGRNPAVTVATYAKTEGVQVHITVQAETEEAAAETLGTVETEIRGLLGDAVFGTDDETLASVVGALLDTRELTIAVMESATGGELSSMLTDQHGSSEHFLGGIVAYSRACKEANGVDPNLCATHGLISAEVAVAMARAARDGMNADIGLSTTGIAGTEPVEGKPPGTCFVAASMVGRDEVREIHRPAARPIAKRHFAQCALDLLRRQLLSVEGNAS